MKSHRADLVSLFFGLVFLTVAGWWAITYFFDVRLNVPNFGWFAAGALILVGVLGIVASLRRDRTDEDEVDKLQPVREPALVSPITEETLTDPTPTWRLDLPEPPRSDPFESPRSEPFESPRPASACQIRPWARRTAQSLTSTQAPRPATTQCS